VHRSNVSKRDTRDSTPPCLSSPQLRSRGRPPTPPTPNRSPPPPPLRPPPRPGRIPLHPRHPPSPPPPPPRLQERGCAGRRGDARGGILDADLQKRGHFRSPFSVFVCPGTLQTTCNVSGALCAMGAHDGLTHTFFFCRQTVHGQVPVMETMKNVYFFAISVLVSPLLFPPLPHIPSSSLVLTPPYSIVGGPRPHSSLFDCWWGVWRRATSLKGSQEPGKAFPEALGAKQHHRNSDITVLDSGFE